MAYIYVIENTENNKKYIGKTNFSVERRFKEHLRDSRRTRHEKRPLYNAIKKYGEDKFSYRILEEISEAEAAEAEIKWIRKFDSYKSGYNATLGGDGTTYLDYDRIVDLALNTSLSRKEVANKCNCSVDGVTFVLESRNIKVDWRHRADTKARKALGHEVIMVDKDTDVELLIFPSLREAAKYLFLEGYTKTATMSSTSGVASHISSVARGKGKTAYGFKWKHYEV